MSEALGTMMLFLGAIWLAPALEVARVALPS